jgi:hypothetical protein
MVDRDRPAKVRFLTRAVDQLVEVFVAKMVDDILRYDEFSRGQESGLRIGRARYRTGRKCTTRRDLSAGYVLSIGGARESTTSQDLSRAGVYAG